MGRRPGEGAEREAAMGESGLDRRGFFRTAVVGGAAAAAAASGALVAGPEAAAQPAAAQADQAATPAPGYTWLNLDEAAFVEALVDHMVPEDELTPKGTDLGINIYIDRALASGWGK